MCACTHANTHASHCCELSGRPGWHLSGGKGSRLLECSDTEWGMVFLMVKAAFGERYLVVLIGQCLSWGRRERRRGRKGLSLRALASFGFRVLGWLWPPGLVTAVPGVEVPQYGEGHREYGLSCGTNKGHEFMSTRRALARLDGDVPGPKELPQSGRTETGRRDNLGWCQQRLAGRLPSGMTFCLAKQVTPGHQAKPCIWFLGCGWGQLHANLCVLWVTDPSEPHSGRSKVLE